MDEQQSNSPNEKFVGRKTELGQFERAIRPRNSWVRFLLGPNTKIEPTVFLPYGIGGIGKTTLSRECLERAEKAGWARIEINWDRANTRPTDEIEMMNIIAEQIRKVYGDKSIEEFLKKQKQIKFAKENIQRLQQENQERWLSYIDDLKMGANTEGGSNELSSAVGGVGALVNIGADALARAEDNFVKWLASTGRIKPDEELLYKDKSLYLSRFLVKAISEAISKQPLVILFDTCEVLSPKLEEWLRDIIVCPLIERKKPVIIIVSGQHNQYRERQVDFGNGIIEHYKGYADRLSNPPPISWNISRFVDPEIADYIREQGLEAKQELIDFIQELARGVPYAVQLVTRALLDLGIEYVRENFPPKDSASFSTDEMITLVTQRFLHYCLKEEIDLERVQGLSILRNWDEGGLAAAWRLTKADSTKKILQILEARYSFILPDRKLHEIVRDFVRQDLRTANETIARALGKNLAEYYLPVWEMLTKSLPSLAHRVNEPRWRTLTFDTLNALFWYNEEAAIKFLAKRVIESMTFDISYAASLLELTHEFRKPPEWCSTRSHGFINILKRIVEGDNREELLGLDALLGESNELDLESEHQAILFIWKSENCSRRDDFENALQFAINAKEKLSQSDNVSLKSFLARNFNSIGWKLGLERGVAKPSESALSGFMHAISLQPNAGYLHVGLGVMHHGLDQNEEAARAIEYGIQLGEKKSWALNWLGNIYSEINNMEEAAIEAYKKAIELDSKSAHPWHGIGEVYRFQRNYNDAINAYNKAIELDPKFANPWSGLGLIYDAQNQQQNAIDAFNKAIEADPKDPYAWNILGNYKREKGQYQEAINAFNKAIELKPKFALPWNGLGNTYYDQEQYQDAINAYSKAIELDPKYAPPWNGLGNSYRNLGKADEAIKAYRKAIELDPDNSRRWYTLAESCRDADLWQEAIEAYNNAIKFNNQAAYAWVSLGNVHRDHGHYKEAFDAYDTAIKLDSKLSDPWFELGHLYLRSKSYEEAIANFQKSIDLKSDDPYCWNGLGYAHFKFEKYENALSAFDKAIELDPSNGEFHYSRIRALRSLGQDKDAIAEMELTKSLIKGTNEYNQACFELICGNIDTALTLLTQAISKKPRTRIWARHDPDFESIRDDSRFKELIGE